MEPWRLSRGRNETLVLVLRGNEEHQATESSKLQRICDRFLGALLGATGSTAATRSNGQQSLRGKVDGAKEFVGALFDGNREQRATSNGQQSLRS